jgi:hypothetical protein
VSRLRRGFGRNLWGILNCESEPAFVLMGNGRKALREQQKDGQAVEKLTSDDEKGRLTAA